MSTGAGLTPGLFDADAIIDVDLDGVCADYAGALARRMEQDRGLPIGSIPPPDTYNLTRASGWPLRTADEFHAFHTAAVADHLYRDLPLLGGTRDALQTLSSLGLHIRIVTHRLVGSGHHQTVVADTAAWLDANDLPYESLCFSGAKDTLKAAVHIEDSPQMVDALVTAGERVITMDQPYNRRTHAHLRARSWAEITEAIQLTLRDRWRHS